ncbi:hypothetical protein POJ06DRAFT_262526 [Lipomyces tetrasporus]|uniref:Protein phosphatase 1 regulatory subunit 7 n=1 Tax=Lipomyces tetrasporus TaxID=54092 RepID=A0AAD7VPG1_9ASCO|nr:uncharacterized protein POJ06DRAFT_262526 [Lipomyces tetrasporus]KAJ8097103.1 hypothetical protein POJ06DRAFT_262526 [Lipomyces tetrasporus]
MTNPELRPAGGKLISAATSESSGESTTVSSTPIPHIVRPSSPASSDADADREVIEPDEDLLNDLPHDVEDIDLVQLRIQSIPALNLSRFTKLQNLCLRENLVQQIEGLDEVGPHLHELDLYDNRISAIENLGPEEGEGVWLNLENLDLSFNKIRRIRHVSHLKNVRNLYFVQNKITKIENLDGLKELVNLELGGNRLRDLENLDSLTGLRQLWVGKNKITRLQNLASLKSLRLLSIQANRIVKLENLEELEALEELYVSHNGIEKIEGLEKNKNLRILDITSNRITHLENLKHLTNLEELWASSNKLESFEEIEEQLKGISTLETVYLEGNPLHLNDPKTYRNKVRLHLGPSLTQIDATYVTESQAGIR